MTSLGSDNNNDNNRHFNYLRETIVRLGDNHRVVPDSSISIDASGTTLNITLPPYDKLCGEPCQDGIYLSLSIDVPFNASQNIVCLGKVTDQDNSAGTTHDDGRRYCTAVCGHDGDFSGCPTLKGGGLWLMKDACKGFATDPATCLNEDTSEECAYQTPAFAAAKQVDTADAADATDADDADAADAGPTCTACPPTALCPGGARLWPKRGFWKANERDVATLPVECPPPSKQRCVGWDGSTLSTRCGQGYAQGTHLCRACAKGWFNTMSNRTCQPCAALVQDGPQGEDAAAAAAAGHARGESSEEIGWALMAFGFVIVSLTALVFVIASRMGGDRSTGLSRALAVLFYALVSLQLISQVGKQATGFEHPIVLRLYWWLSVLSSLDTSESIPTECMDVPYFWSNLTMAGALSVLGLWLVMMWIPACRPERGCGGMCCCSSQRRDCVRKRVTPQIRRYNLSLLILLYAVVARTAINSVHCVDDGISGGRLVQAINPRVVCWENPHHHFNGSLGWATLILYCFGLPAFLTWMVHYAPWFDHMATREDDERRHDKRSNRRGKQRERSVKHHHNITAGLGAADPGKGQRSTRNSINPMFMTSADRKRQAKRIPPKGVEDEVSKAAEEGNPCCRMNHLGSVRARQRSSVLRFVFYRPVVYVSFKPLVECDFHIGYLYFRPLYLVVLFVLASLVLVPADAASGLGGWRPVIGSVILFCYVFLLLWKRPMRRTRSWKMPVIVLVITVAWLALILNYVASLVDENGEHAHQAILFLSFFVVILSGLLICVIIPLSAVYELWSGAVRERKCQRLKEQLMRRRRRQRDNAGAAGNKNVGPLVGGGDYDHASWDDLTLMAVDDLEELQQLVVVLKTDGDQTAASRGGGVELVSIGSLPRMTANPLQMMKIEKEQARLRELALGVNKKGGQRGSKPDKRGSAPGWDHYIDEDSGCPYFYNRATHNSVWSVEETWNSDEQDWSTSFAAAPATATEGEGGGGERGRVGDLGTGTGT